MTWGSQLQTFGVSNWPGLASVMYATSIADQAPRRSGDDTYLVTYGRGRAMAPPFAPICVGFVGNDLLLAAIGGCSSGSGSDSTAPTGGLRGGCSGGRSHARFVHDGVGRT